MVEITDLRKVVAEVEQKEAEEITKELLAQGVDPFDVLEDGTVVSEKRFRALILSIYVSLLGFRQQCGHYP